MTKFKIMDYTLFLSESLPYNYFVFAGWTVLEALEKHQARNVGRQEMSLCEGDNYICRAGIFL